MRIVVHLPDEQIERIDDVGSRLGIKRSDAIRFLLTYGLTHEQFRGASLDSARASLAVADIAAREIDMQLRYGLDLDADRDRVLVTPGSEDKSVHPVGKGKGRRGHD